MPVIIQYLLKLSVSAGVIYAFYYLVLRHLTFYSLNRWYLSGYTVLCFVIPFINIASIANKADEKMPALNYIPTVPNIKNYMPEAIGPAVHNSYTIWDALFAMLAVGSAFLLIKMIVQIISFMRMKRKAELISDKDSAIYHVDEQIMPFSFGNSIYLNKNMHTDNELAEIIMHEYVHVRQLHSADILIAELFCIVNWYNPFAWFIRHSIRQNLEFIADDNVVRSGINKKDYQYHLLKVVGVPQYRLANQFNFSSLKKRIIMMNRQRSAKIHLLKFMFILPLLAVTLMAFRSEIVNTVNKIAPTSIPISAVANPLLPGNLVSTGTFKSAATISSKHKEVKRPDTAVESMNLTAYFGGEVIATNEVNNSYLIVTKNGDRIDSYSNLTAINVKRGDKIKKGDVIGLFDVDTTTGITKLRHRLYNGSGIVYDSDESDTTKGAYAIVPAGVYSSPAPATVTLEPVYSTGTGSYTTKAYAAYPAQNYKAAGAATYRAKNNRYVVNLKKNQVDSIRISGNNAIVVTGYATPAYNTDELTYTIDPRHMEESQFEYMEKQFADNGFKLKIHRNQKNDNDTKLRIEISGSNDNNTSSASASFNSDDLYNKNCLIKVTGDKKTGLVSIATCPLFSVATYPSDK